jgi:molecular chaperone DnaJ
LGYVQTTSVCPDCQGEGRKPETPCSDCQGEGRVLKEQNISVNIPPGIFDGAVLNLKGKGEAGQRGQSAGDLLLKVYIRPSKDFRREGDSIHTDLELHFLQALLGDEVKIKTVHGTTKLKIPAGTQSEQVLRIKDQGMPVLNKAAFGDHFVHVKVRIPKKLSKKEKQLYSEAVKEAGLNITPEKGFLENIFN